MSLIKNIFRFAYLFLTRPTTGPVALFGVFIVAPFIISAIFGQSFFGGVVIFIVASVLLLLIAEVLFRIGYRAICGGPYIYAPSLPFKDIYIEPHPYIPFIYKRRAWTQKAEEATYPLHKGRFKYGQYQTNSLGFLNGPKGNREVAIPKPNGMLRVNCIGASTTGNYIEEGGTPYSYPMELEKILQSRIGNHVEVNNCAQGGYNSADLLVRFALQVIDTKPDIVVIYHAYNDVRSYLTGNFSSDYSHSRRNIGERYWLYDLSSRIPNVPLKFFNFLIRLWLPSNIRYSLSTEVSRGTFDTKIDPSEGLGVYKRNLKHIIDLSLSSGSRVILSTYAIYLFEEIKDSAIHQMYRDIVSRENDIMRDLAKEHNLPLVDNAALVPKEENMFVDSVHFTPEGMSTVASNIADAIVGMNKLGD